MRRIGTLVSSKAASRVASVMLGIVLSMNMMAQSAGISPFGYGKDATGGGNATPTLVSTVNDLKTALGASGSKVIIITKDLTFSNMLSVKATNKTLMALPGVKLTSTKQDATTSGILYFQSGSSNIILRNLTLVGPGAYDCDGNDLLCFDGVTKAWVDHCDFQDGCDGNFDNKGKTDNVTVSWCRFRYLKAPKAGGPGGSDDHRYSNLLGSSSSDKPADGTYNMTWAYCWWDNGCVERMLRCRNASLHFLNCYWNSNTASYYIGPENADAYIEGCTFAGGGSVMTSKSGRLFYENYGGTNGAKFVNSVSTVTKNTTLTNVTSRTVPTPSYPYTAMTAAAAVKAVTDGSCGAGATLEVTTDGQVSQDCGGGGTEDCYSLLSSPSLPSGMTITVNGAAPTYDATNGITLASNDDYLCIDVTGMNAKIKTAKVMLKTGSQDVAKGFVYGNSCSAGFSGTEILNTAKTFTEYTLTGLNSPVLSIRRKGTGVNVSNICLELTGTTPTSITLTHARPAAEKVMIEGRIYVRRDGKVYPIW